MRGIKIKDILPILLLILSILSTANVFASSGGAISPSNWEGSNFEGHTQYQSVTAHGSTEHIINSNIPSNKIVILSLSDNPNIKTNTKVTLTLAKVNAGTAPQRSKEGGWYCVTKMTYFKALDTKDQSYKVIVNNSEDSSYSYTINVYVLDAISFVKADTKGSKTSYKTYCISDTPEHLNNNYQKGEYGYYLQRSLIQSNANIYWEHINEFPNNSMKFGVLLYNQTKSSVTVTLNRRSFESASDGATYPTIDVWVDWFNAVKKPDESGVTSTVTIQPSNAQWICLYTVGKRSLDNVTNGLVDISIPSGVSLCCDTYIMTSGTSTDGLTYVEHTRRNVTNAKMASAPAKTDLIRGSGVGAMLSSNISGNGPFRICITGYDMPYLNDGELIALSDSLDPPIKNGLNYGVIYCLAYNRTGTTIGQVKYNPNVNSGYRASSDGGIYAIVRKYYNGVWYPTTSALLTNNSNVFTFDKAVTNGAVYFIVISGKSGLPAEVNFR